MSAISISDDDKMLYSYLKDTDRSLVSEQVQLSIVQTLHESAEIKKEKCLKKLYSLEHQVAVLEQEAKERDKTFLTLAALGLSIFLGFEIGNFFRD